MLKRKSMRQKGKNPLSHILQEIKIGDYVALKAELSRQVPFPKRMQGKTGIITAKRGEACIVKVNDGNKEKTYIVPAIHLKKLKISK